MKLYRIYRINESGIPKKKMEIHAHCIDGAWNGSKCWLTSGLFLVVCADGTDARTFRLEV